MRATKIISGRHILRQMNELKAQGWTTLWSGNGQLCLQAPLPGTVATPAATHSPACCADRRSAHQKRRRLAGEAGPV